MHYTNIRTRWPAMKFRDLIEGERGIPTCEREAASFTIICHSKALQLRTPARFSSCRQTTFVVPKIPALDAGSHHEAKDEGHIALVRGAGGKLPVAINVNAVCQQRLNLR